MATKQMPTEDMNAQIERELTAQVERSCFFEADNEHPVANGKLVGRC